MKPEVEKDNIKILDQTTIDTEPQPRKEIDDAALLALFSDIMGQSTESALTSLSKKNQLDNVAIFVDYDNVYWTLMNNYSHDPNHSDPLKNLFVQLWERYGQEQVRTFRAYADFEKIKTELTSLQKKRVQIRHVYSNGKDGSHRKNSSDIELCIDAIEHTYKDPNVSCYVFVTADSDMIPVISRMVYKGKRVELFYLSNSVPKHIDMLTFANYSEDLLSFLNVSVEKVTIENYVIEALKIIQDWHIVNSSKDLFLGNSYLRKDFTRKLSIPPNTSSQLLENLTVNKLVEDGVKLMSSGDKKNSLKLTDEGTALLARAVDTAAPSKE
ncbi:NYN domain-containing protein [Paenibacillus xylanexedens]|uniref:NYN domain-containing protein n=1 Tax=Paenibacillus xylanexedens TaxID=528191 RepID=UPI000B33F4FB|nr:NYN domain-containing protein [Paenibacillus xylanexedens]